MVPVPRNRRRRDVASRRHGRQEDSRIYICSTRKQTPLLAVILAPVHAQVLSQLGVWILDAPALGNQARNPLVLKYADACTPSGVLNALQQALFPAAAPPPPAAATTTPALPESAAGAERRDFGPGGAARRRVDNRFQSVAPSERDALRRFLSGQQRTGAQLTAEQTELLKGLPVYRVHDYGAPAAAAEGDGWLTRRGGAGVGAGGAGAQFTSISGAERLLLAPRGSDPALLGPTFAVEERGDTELLENLGVTRVGKGVFFREHVLPRAVEPRGGGRSLPLGEYVVNPSTRVVWSRLVGVALGSIYLLSGTRRGESERRGEGDSKYYCFSSRLV